MRRLRSIVLAFLVLFTAMPSAMAVQPDEVLADPALESRARDLSSNLRCMVCQNQSIDESDAPLARDLRLLVRERLSAGDSDAEVESYLVSRYGEFVLMQPRLNLANAALWAAPLLLLAVGGVFLLRAARRDKPVATEGLSAEEERRLAELLTAPTKTDPQR